MVVWREESLLIILVLHGGILLECAAVAHASVLADLAMRGLAISFLTRASVALSDSFVGFFTVSISTSNCERKLFLLSPRHHDRSGDDVCLLHYAQMSVQS
jgi:hypothetical protein